MNILKKIFCGSDDTNAIGLCKFNDDFMKLQYAKKRAKKRLQKEATLSQMLSKVEFSS